MLLPSIGGGLYGYSETSVTGLGAMVKGVRGMMGQFICICLWLEVTFVAMLCKVEVIVLKGWLRPKANEIAQNS
jgi:hypothetical protein